MKILVADDDAGVRECLRMMLDIEGFQVIEAANGRKALIAAIREQPGLILLDWTMPEQDGMETLKLLKNNVSTCDIPVVMLTANHEEDALSEATFEGADAYIAKPFDVDVVMMVVRNLCRESEKTPPAGNAD